MNRQTYTVIYRKGGTENFEWRKCVPVLTMEHAIVQRDNIITMGYSAKIHKTSLLDAIGVPETYEA